MHTQKPKILFIDTDTSFLEEVTSVLPPNEWDIFTATHSEEGIFIAKKILPSLIFTEIAMPEIDGIAICTQLRNSKEVQNTLIAFISNRKEDYSILAALKAGADDYLTKPINPTIFPEKVKSLLRRNLTTQNLLTKHSLLFKHITIDPIYYKVFKNSEEISLTRKEFELLFTLVKHSNHIVKREEIIKTIWNSSIKKESRTIDVHISKIRDKLALETLRTIKGIGYILEE